MHTLQHQSGKRPVFLLLHDPHPSFFSEAICCYLPLSCVLVLEEPTLKIQPKMKGAMIFSTGRKGTLKLGWRRVSDIGRCELFYSLTLGRQ
jgi:hypothetical protein